MSAPLCSLPIRAALVPLAVVQAVSALATREKVAETLEDGRTRWVFDLRCRENTRSYLRVFAPCLLNRPGMDYWPDIESVLKACVPWSSDPIPSSVGGHWSVSAQHVAKLARAGFIQFSQRPARARGMYSAPRICRQSLIRLLIQRSVA